MQRKGFTLIELMVVVAIIGLLAAIAVPNFIKFQCRSKQSEAKGNLKALYTAQETFRAEFDRYTTIASIPAGSNGATSTNAIGFVPKGAKLRYSYVSDGVVTAFSGVASAAPGTISDGADTWRITQANDLTTTLNACD
jgi:type IV pilus assembly protein PilA